MLSSLLNLSSLDNYGIHIQELGFVICELFIYRLNRALDTPPGDT